MKISFETVSFFILFFILFCYSASVYVGFSYVKLLKKCQNQHHFHGDNETHRDSERDYLSSTNSLLWPQRYHL